MNKRIFLFPILFCFWAVNCHSLEVVWSGKVNSSGVPTTPVKLEMHREYQIIVSGFVNLGKWVQQGQKLANDACYEYSQDGNLLTPTIAIRNSADVSVCHGKYHPNHIYESRPFKAEQDRIFFWVQDTSYDDNEGVFDVQIIGLTKEKTK